jgi:quinol monooxygenase YgiN
MSETPKKLICAGTFRASKGVTHSVMKAMEAMATASRAEDGCEDYSYARDVFDPTLIRVFEIWRDTASFKAHRSMPHLAAWRAKWPELGLGDAMLSTYEIDAGAPV